jgi:hypothetical protein
MPDASHDPESRHLEIAEQAFLSPTDKEDLAAALHNANIPIESDDDQDEVINDDDIPQEYTESYGTGVQDPPGRSS